MTALVVALAITGALLLLAAVAIVVLAVLLARARRRYAALEQSLVPLPGGAAAGPRQLAATAVRVAVGTAKKVRRHGVGGFLMSSLDDLSRWALENRSEIIRVAAPDGTVTIAFSDIENSTAMNEELGDTSWVRILRSHDELVRAETERQGGFVVKSQGDGFMIAFRETDSAVKAAIAIQTALTEHPPRALRRVPITIRIGMHVGTAVSRDGDYFGRNVAMAARVAAEATGGEIVISNEARAALADPDAVHFGNPREVLLKGLADVHTIWPVEWAPAPAG